MLQRLEDAGAAAVVLPSLFEEQIEHEAVEVHRVLEAGAESFAEALSYFPELDDYDIGPDAYLEHVAAAKEAARDPGDREPQRQRRRAAGSRYARLIEEAGADALELNVYFVAADPDDELRRRSRRATSSSSGRCARRSRSRSRSRSARTSARSANMARAPGRGRRRRARALQPLLQPDIDLETLERRARR